MKKSNIHFLSQLPHYIKNFHHEKRVHTIFPRYCIGNIKNCKIRSFYNDFIFFYYKLIAEIATKLIRNNFNYKSSIEITELLINESKAYDKILSKYGEKIENLIKSSNYLVEYFTKIKNYVENISARSNIRDQTLIVGFTEEHPLISTLSDKDIKNCEIIFVENTYSTEIIHNNEIINNRRILLENPESWHNENYKQIEGIKVIDCISMEEEAQTIKKIVNDNLNCSLMIDDIHLLQRLEILLDDFSYDKPKILDSIIIFLLRILEDDLSESFLSMIGIKNIISIEKLNESKKIAFSIGENFVDMHLKYFKDITDISLSNEAEHFVRYFRDCVSNIKFRSTEEYKTIFSLLSENISNRKASKIVAITSDDFNLNSDMVIISTRNWKSNASFERLLHIDKIYIVHNKKIQEPEWLVKLRVLLSKTCYINLSREKSVKNQEYSPAIANPEISSRPRILSEKMIEMLIRDPYAFYIRYILKLRLPQTEEINFGVFIHKILAKHENSNNNYSLLLEYADEELKKYEYISQARSIWWPKFKKIANCFVEENNKRLGEIEKAETVKKLHFQVREYTLTVTCDRIEFLNDGTIGIVKYKTGVLPSAQDIKAGMSPQLLLQGIAASKAFKQKKVSKISYWQLKPNGVVIKTIPNVQNEMDIMIERLEDLLKKFATMEFISTGYYKEYQHISRAQEILV